MDQLRPVDVSLELWGIGWSWEHGGYSYSVFLFFLPQAVGQCAQGMFGGGVSGVARQGSGSRPGIDEYDCASVLPQAGEGLADEFCPCSDVQRKR
ncbi:hypothetical protein GCM10023354_05600 [Garicola koreensis]